MVNFSNHTPSDILDTDRGSTRADRYGIALFWHTVTDSRLPRWV